MTYLLDLTTLRVSQQDPTTNGLPFTVVTLPTDPNFFSLVLKYQVLGAAVWTELDLGTPVIGSTILIPGLLEETKYEVLLLAKNALLDLSDPAQTFRITTLSSLLPPLQPIQTRVLDSLVLACQAIIKGASYFNDIAVVMREQAGAFDITDFPTIVVGGLSTEESNKTARGTPLQDVHLLVMLEVHFQTNDLYDQDAELLIHDVKKAILQDPQRTSLAVGTEIISTQKFHSPTGDPSGLAIVVADIHFRHKEKDPAVGVC